MKTTGITNYLSTLKSYKDRLLNYKEYLEIKELIEDKFSVRQIHEIESEILNYFQFPIRIQINTMYRDAGNYKSSHEEIFWNDLNISANAVEHHIKSKIGFYEPVIVQKYGLESISPVQNEHSPGGEYDHPYVEITQVEETTFAPSKEEGRVKMISEFINKLQSDDHSEFEEKQKEEALQSNLQQLKALGYQVSIWSIEDVQARYDVSDEKAHEILEATLGSEPLIEHINSVIEEVAEIVMDLTETKRI